MELIFTQEIKDNWVNALESGNFTQGYGKLEDDSKGTIRYCCIGVLGHITKGLSNYNCLKKGETIPENGICPYAFLRQNKIDTKPIWMENDLYSDNDHDPDNKRPEAYKDDYSNVIEIIKALPINTKS